MQPMLDPQFQDPSDDSSPAASADDGELEAQEGADEPGPVRLNKYLADHGIASRRRCDELIAQGKVSIDGEPVTVLGTKIDPRSQSVEVDGVVLEPEVTRKRYYLLNKPRGIVCTNDRHEARMRAIDLITDRNKGRIYTVGRLDEESTGLILLTNDGEFTQRIAHPRHGVPKTYLVKIRGRVESEAIEKIQEGVRLSEGRTAGARVRVEKRSVDASILSVTLREGKNREVRRVFAAVGYKVQRLHRTRIGTLSDRRLKLGEWRPLTREEVEELTELASDPKLSERLLHRDRDERAPQRLGRERHAGGRGAADRSRRRAFHSNNGAHPGARPGASNGARPGARPGSRNGARPGARTGDRRKSSPDSQGFRGARGSRGLERRGPESGNRDGRGRASRGKGQRP
jgi:23S rRNA pseudouridine2605 synthase